jgi:di/tricarboxylate transporter
VIALIASGVLSVNQALSGFGSPAVVMVACLLVVAEILDRTGVARAVGNLILRHGGSNEMLLVVLLMLAAALLGSVMSSTASLPSSFRSSFASRQALGSTGPRCFCRWHMPR